MAKRIQCCKVVPLIRQSCPNSKRSRQSWAVKAFRWCRLGHWVPRLLLSRDLSWAASSMLATILKHDHGTKFQPFDSISTRPGYRLEACRRNLIRGKEAWISKQFRGWVRRGGVRKPIERPAPRKARRPPAWGKGRPSRSSRPSRAAGPAYWKFPSEGANTARGSRSQIQGKTLGHRLEP